MAWVRVMYQSFETLTPTSELPAPCCTKESPVCVESAVTAFLKSPRQDLEKHFQTKTTWLRAMQILYVKCSNYQAARKCDS